ncbi:hypothetical protein [Actinophytocola sp. KF-1]
MTGVLEQLLDARGVRPAPVTWAATVAAVSGGATLVGASLVVVAAFGAGGVAWAAAALQVSAAVLLIAGGARLAVGAGRGVLFAGIAAQLLTCAMHVSYAVTAVAGDPEDAALVPVVLAVAGTFTALAAVDLYLALRPATAAFAS